MDFVIRYKGECVLLEVKAKDGNTKSTRTILNHPEKYHDYHAIKLGNYNVGGKEGMMTMLFPKQTQRMAAFLPAFSSVMIALIVGMQNSGLATSLAATHFAQYPLATIPGAVFSVWHNISGAILANFYAKTAK